MAAEKAQPAPALAYDRSGSQYATRRQFRVLLVLVLLNLVITLQFAYFPGLTAAVRQRWAGYQQKRERAAAVKQALALEQQVMSSTVPPGTVVWDDNPETAAKLLAGQGYKRVRLTGLDPLLSNFPRTAAAQTPDALEQLWAGLWAGSPYKHRFPMIGGMPSVDVDQHALVFAHGLKTPSGEDRLVCVYVQGGMSLHFPRDRPPQPDQPLSGTASKALQLVALPCVPGKGEKPIAVVREGRSELLIHPGGEELSIPWTWTPAADGRPERFRIDAPNTYRFYAGRPDPADPSRFTIDYDMNGTRGTLRGRLKGDETIELVPSTGRVVGSRWYQDPPSTRPGEP